MLYKVKKLLNFFSTSHNATEYCISVNLYTSLIPKLYWELIFMRDRFVLVYHTTVVLQSVGIRVWLLNLWYCVLYEYSILLARNLVRGYLPIQTKDVDEKRCM